MPEKYDKYEKYARLKKLLAENHIPHWKCAALAVIRERTFRYKMSRTGSRFTDTEMFAIQRNVFPDKTLEEIFGE